MDLTLDQAQADLRQVADAAPAALEASLADAAERAAARLRSEWPRDTGESARAWRAVGSSVDNDVDYTPYVHDGLADRLVPQVLADEEAAVEEDLDRRLRAAGGW